MAILVTGGAGYIGSHTVVELQNAGYDVVVLDNLSNASEKSLERVSKITGKPVKFYKADILDRDALNEVFDKEDIDSCIHFAGLKAVGESVAKPWEYYENNIAGTLTLVDVMRKHNVKNIIFSSSATVYGDPAIIPITEECPKGQCTNPYGWTKSMLEQILTDIQKADPEWNVVLLRYFNPIGAMKALCDAIGVDCRYVHADSKASNPSHQWNQVRVGGKWYILDAQSGGFLLGSRTWKKKAGMSWDTKGLPTCSVTDYKK